MNLPKSLPVRYHSRIMHWDDERNIGNSIIICLNDGWEFDIDPWEKMHVDGFDTIKEAVDGVINSIPCTCKSCVKGETI